MPTVNLGKVGMTLKGVYDNEVQYEKLDVVYYDDSTYCAKVNTQGNLPTDETYWQLLVAPNPLATWKPNTKDDEGYVEKGDGHTDSLWATDSEGNPAWVKKEDVATKVDTNSKTADGIVTKGQDSPDKVWATDSEGNPAWRKLDSNFQYVIDTSKWGTPPSNGYKPIAKFTNNSETSDAKIVFEGLDNIAPDSKEETFYIRVEPNKTSLYRGGASANIAAPYGISGPLPYYIGIFCASNPTSGYNMNVVELYVSSSLPTSSGPISAILFGLRYSGDVTIEWYDIDTSNWVTTPPSGATIRQFTKLALETISGSNDGTVPMPPYKKNTPLIFSALYPYNAYGLPEWRPFSDLSLLTSTEIQEAISTAIANADFSSFEIVEIKPTPETAVENKFYLVKNEDTEHYDIYAKIGEQVEWIDDTTVDLTNYATKEELPTNVSELENDANYTSLTDEQYNTLLQLLG